MKCNLLFILMLFFFASTVSTYAQGVSINEDGADPEATAMLDIKSSDKGLLIPRMTSDEIRSIVHPADGLQVYNTEEGKLYIYVATDDTWKEVSYGAGTLEPYFVCGDPLVDDRDGQSYATKLYGSQCWMLKNLNYGTMTTDYNQLNNGIIEKYCYQNNTAYCDDYGGLYQWNEAMQYTTQQGVQGICPDGWHIPTNMEWFTFENLIDPTITNPTSIGPQGGNYSGGWLKEAGYTHWNSPNTLATNATEFTALGSGYRYGTSSYQLKYEADFWTSTQYDSDQAYDRELYYNNPFIYRVAPTKTHGLGLRCIKD